MTGPGDSARSRGQGTAVAPSATAPRATRSRNSLRFSCMTAAPASRLLFRFFVHPFVQALDASKVGARALDLWKIFAVRSEIHSLGRILGRDTLRPKNGNLFHQVCQIALPRRNQRTAFEGRPVARKHGVEVEIRERVERGQAFVKLL